ncbi:MAG: hypothetical protein HY953_08850 [Candidatus Rokubacteria bacterium]|nr:hypothetical protein [Candidatus Rokubacteria bacterium]
MDTGETTGTTGACEEARGPDGKESVMAAIRACAPEGRSWQVARRRATTDQSISSSTSWGAGQAPERAWLPGLPIPASLRTAG